VPPGAIGQFAKDDATVMDDKECFDVIDLVNVIEHFEEDEKVLANLALEIVSGGALLITVPQHRWFWSATDDYACHVRRYKRDELVLKVVRAGMEVEYVSSVVSLLLPLMWLSRFRAKKVSVDPMREFKIPRWLNAGLKGV
jgi:SAM-dependent methyltransferase